MVCRIKTGHSNLVSRFARGWGHWLRYFTEAKAEVKYRANARIRQPKHDTRFEWPVSVLIMTRYPFLLFKTHKTSAKKSSFTYDRRHHLILPLLSVHALPTLNAHLLLRSADWWRHNILLSIAWTIWIMINNENSTNLPADSLQAPQIQIVWGFLSGPRDRQWDHVLLLISKP